MSIKKYSLLTIGLYAIVYPSPIFFLSSGNQYNATIISYSIGAALMIVLYSKQTEEIRLEKQKHSWLYSLGVGFGGIFAALILQNIIMRIQLFFGQSIVSENTTGILETVQQLPLFLLVAMVCAPIMEEFVFRRSLNGLLEKHMNIWSAMVINSLLFAIIHFDGHLLLYFSLGFFFNLLYYATGRIWTPIIAHAGMNTVVLLANLLLL